MERREISSILGRKRESCEFMAARVSRRSQGERRTVWFKKKEGREENAIPNVNPSDLWILVSEQGE